MQRRDIRALIGRSAHFYGPSVVTSVLTETFLPTMKELVELIYQYERDYLFDSGKFGARFESEPTPYSIGLREIVEHYYG